MTLTRTVYPWIDLTDRWEPLRKLAAAIDKAKKGFPSLDPMSPESRFVGLLGEEAYAQTHGLPGINEEVLARGDGGTDFPGVDIKTVEAYWKNPYLKVEVKKIDRAPAYALVALDFWGKRARYLGWATKEDLIANGIRNFKHVDDYWLTADQLRDGVAEEVKDE